MCMVSYYLQHSPYNFYIMFEVSDVPRDQKNVMQAQHPTHPCYQRMLLRRVHKPLQNHDFWQGAATCELDQLAVLYHGQPHINNSEHAFC